MTPSVTIPRNWTQPGRASLQWNEPTVREILRSWSDQARSVCLVTPPSAFLLDERVFVSLGVLKVALHKAKGTPLPEEWAFGDDLTIS